MILSNSRRDEGSKVGNEGRCQTAEVLITARGGGYLITGEEVKSSTSKLLILGLACFRKQNRVEEVRTDLPKVCEVQPKDNPFWVS